MRIFLATVWRCLGRDLGDIAFVLGGAKLADGTPVDMAMGENWLAGTVACRADTGSDVIAGQASDVRSARQEADMAKATRFHQTGGLEVLPWGPRPWRGARPPNEIARLPEAEGPDGPLRPVLGGGRRHRSRHLRAERLALFTRPTLNNYAGNATT